MSIGTTQQYRPCDVHRLVDFDMEPKNCFYCGLCDAWICQECSSNWVKRLKAAVKRKFEPGYKGLSNYTDLIEGELKSGHSNS